MGVAIEIKNLKKSFNGINVFEDISLNIREGSITALLGPNGSGKSTLLNILAGIVPYDEGKVYIKNNNPYKLSYIFQNYRESLLPWRNNYKNLILPLEIQHKNTGEIKQSVAELVKLFSFQFNWKQYPYELSGGQQQILAFMRGIITQPKLLFIDEPFSALDYENNLYMRECLQKYYLTYNPTILLITHNIEEMVHLASTIVVLSKKPGRELEIINNPIPYPRTIQSLKSEAFHQVKNNALSAFQKAANL